MRQYNAKHEWSKRDNRQLFFSCSGGRTSTESLCSVEWRDAVEEKRLILRICLIDCGVQLSCQESIPACSLAAGTSLFCACSTQQGISCVEVGIVRHGAEGGRFRLRVWNQPSDYEQNNDWRERNEQGRMVCFCVHICGVFMLMVHRKGSHQEQSLKRKLVFTPMDDSVLFNLNFFWRLPFPMLELFNVKYILTGYQCFYCLSPGKNVIVSILLCQYRHCCSVDLPVLVEQTLV